MTKSNKAAKHWAAFMPGGKWQYVNCNTKANAVRRLERDDLMKERSCLILVDFDFGVDDQAVDRSTFKL
jgi:hypothetical protein